jgi:hypothetical protein
MLELLSSTERVVSVMTPSSDYEEIGGKAVEKIVDGMAPPLFEAVVKYDEDATAYVDVYFEITRDLTISFAFVVVLYYLLVIYNFITRLKNSMNDEF